MIHFWKQLIKTDYSIETCINKLWANPFFDWIMPILREPLIWLPLYLFIAFYLVRKYQWQGLYMLVVASFTVFFCDTVAAQVIKPWVGRLRPCCDVAIQSSIRMLVGCGGKYSFSSNHAANHFGLSSFLFLAIKKIAGKKWFWLFWWAFIVCYAQVYVGKHFPLDVLCGALLGCIAGVFFYTMWKNTFFGSGGNRPNFNFPIKQQRGKLVSA